jgi:hypothetical protein
MFFEANPKIFLVFSFYHGNTSAFLGQNLLGHLGDPKNGAPNHTQRLFLEKNGPKLCHI